MASIVASLAIGWIRVRSLVAAEISHDRITLEL
jgi:hypothetical protein